MSRNYSTYMTYFMAKMNGLFTNKLVRPTTGWAVFLLWVGSLQSGQSSWCDDAQRNTCDRRLEPFLLPQYWRIDCLCMLFT